MTHKTTPTDTPATLTSDDKKRQDARQFLQRYKDQEARIRWLERKINALKALTEDTEDTDTDTAKSIREALKIDSLLTQDRLIIEPLAYIRGRSLGKCYFIIDEAQNLTPHEVKTIITRAGEGTKMVFTGDIFQIDQPYLDQWSNGLTHLNEKMEGQRLFEHIFLRIGERSEISDIASKLL